jgi:Fe-S-cluster-containing hydrogenase component 2
MLLSYARLECERLARKHNQDTVTAAIVAEADRRYELAIGRDVMGKLRTMAAGELTEPLVPEEFFEDDSCELFSIQMCPSQYGAASNVKIENMRRLVPAMRRRLRDLQITQLMMDCTWSAVMPHSEFRVTVTGCTNACVSPYFSDFGVLGTYTVAVDPDECSGCGRCAEYCSMGAISMREGLPHFDRSICIRCAGCEEFCPVSAIKVSEMGYKVVVGGIGARHPGIARTVTEHTDLDGVLRILEKAVSMIRAKVTEPVRVFSMHRLIEKYGMDMLRD